MRALTKLRSWRPNARRTFAAFAGASVVVASGLGVAGIASALPPGSPGASPVFAPFGGAANHISNLGPLLPAIPAGQTGSAANWGVGINDNPGSVTNTTWTTGDTLTIDVTPNGGQAAQDVTTNSFVEFSGSPAVIVTGGASGATAPTVTSVVGTNPADTSNDIAAGLTDQLTITFTNTAGPFGLTPFTIAILGIKYTTGLGTPFGPIFAFGTYTHSSVGVPITIDPNAAVEDIYVTANNPAVGVLPNAVGASISPINIVETAPGIVQADPIVGDTSILSTGYICIAALAGKWVGTPTISVAPSGVGGTAAIEGVVSIITPLPAPPTPLSGLSTLVAQVLFSSTTVPTTFTFSNLKVNAPGVTGPVGAYVTIDNNSQCISGAAVPIPGNPVYGLSATGMPQVTIYTVNTGHGPTSNGPIFGSDAPQTAVAAMEYQFPVTPGGVCITNNANPESHHIGSTAVITDDLPNGLDGLTASALAGYLGSAVLFTDYGSPTIPTYTMTALLQEGFTSVIFVGGTLAIPDAAVQQVANTISTFCGGTIWRTGEDGTPLHFQTIRIGGVDAAQTAQFVAAKVNSGGPTVAQVNTSGMGGLYNQTLQVSGPAAPNLPLRTAFLVTNQSSADASGFSPMAYALGIPIFVTEGNTLGTPALTGLLDDGVQNVIIGGGQIAVPTAIAQTLIAAGYNVSVIAGTDLTQTSVDAASWAFNTDFTTNGQPLGLGWGNLQFPNECETIQGASNPGSTVFNCDATVAMAIGDPAFGFEDAQSSSVVTGNEFIPLVLTQSAAALGQYVTAFFTAAGSPFGIDPVANPLNPFLPYTGVVIDVILPFGGPIVMPAALVQSALNAISAGANPH